MEGANLNNHLVGLRRADVQGARVLDNDLISLIFVSFIIPGKRNPTRGYYPTYPTFIHSLVYLNLMLFSPFWLIPRTIARTTLHVPVTSPPDQQNAVRHKHTSRIAQVTWQCCGRTMLLLRPSSRGEKGRMIDGTRKSQDDIGPVRSGHFSALPGKTLRKRMYVALLTMVCMSLITDWKGYACRCVKIK
ncbi:hypothetical protein EDB82DRAFT_299825 [Fusarium venenatum]|uniref:uncharacterized protein n=1 Tax=Fusarium venenatum TaxID=56646 RepID=UPI001E129CA0|nr:hypothetical protein EDB82DRAFT_299825 [Fusarium venenatum]